ncbi:MAG TPA: adenylate kinase [Vicinamibacterales bacterium]|nr:adenylate kinase [Vicinamibacterales bacterium]
MRVNLIMLGPPGAGKGTQAERFARLRRIPKISTGDILREAVTNGTELGRIAKATMDAGKLVGDDVMVGIVRERLLRPDTTEGFVLDGFPRTVAQAEALDAMMNGRGPLVVLDFAVPPEELERRLAQRRVCGKCGWTTAADGETVCAKCGGAIGQRSDDAIDVVRKRLQVYQRDTRPLFEYYKSRGALQSIDGDRSPEEVSAAVDAAIGRISKPGTDARRQMK